MKRLTKEQEEALTLLVEFEKRREAISLIDLTNELKLYVPYNRTEEILKDLQDEGYIYDLKFNNGITRETSPFRYRIEPKGFAFYLNIKSQKCEAKTKKRTPKIKRFWRWLRDLPVTHPALAIILTYISLIPSIIAIILFLKTLLG